MRLYVKYIAFVTCFFLFSVCFLVTRFNALLVDIPNIASKLQKEPHAPLGNNNDPLILEGSDKRAKFKVSEAGKARSQWYSTMTAVKFSNLSDSILFYSSFVDYRDGNMGYPYVRTILLKQVTYTVQLSCRFGETLVEGSLYELAENHLQKYSTYIFSCKIPESINIDEIQEWILTDGSNSAILEATYRIPREDSISAYNYDYSICMPFLYGSVYKGKHLVEFAELNKLLGAQRITIYTHKNSLADSLQKALDYYTKERLIEVIEYDLPVKDIWYHGQLVTVTDCLYRNIGVTRFLSFHDLDEFIIPTSMHNLTALFFEIFRGDIASYRIPTRYFRLEEDVPITLNNKKSVKKLDPLYTKCVVRPEMIFEQGIHHTSRVIQDRYQCEALSASLASLHHYKKQLSIADRTNENIERFRQQLNTSYHLALQRIGILD